MNRTQFYAASVHRDEEMRRRSSRWVTALLVVICFPVVLLFVEVPSQVKPFAYLIWAGYMISVLIAFVAITRRKEKLMHAQFGMVCAKCGDVFVGSSLAHVRFTGTCQNCGTHVPLISERTVFAGPECNQRIGVRAVPPEPSVKRSSNGRPPGPGWRNAVHFRQPGPGVLPSPPAWLERRAS